MDVRRSDATQRIVNDDGLNAVNVFGHVTLADVEHWADDYSGVVDEVVDGGVESDVIVVGHVLLLCPGDGVVVLSDGDGPVQSVGRLQQQRTLKTFGKMKKNILKYIFKTF